MGWRKKNWSWPMRWRDQPTIVICPTQHIGNTFFFTKYGCPFCTKLEIHMRHWQPIWSKLVSYFSSGITLDIDVFFLWRTSYWSIEDKTYKKLKEIPSRHVLENLLEQSKHSCLYTSKTHWQFTGILPIYNGRHAKFHNSKL